MKKEVINSAILIVSILLLSGLVSATGGILAGSGSGTNPYQIDDCLDLNKTGTGSYALNANYTLMGDINCSDTKNWDSEAGFLPIATFTGSFNGSNHHITNLFINRVSLNIGLFGIMDGATVSNIYLDNVNITGGSDTGALVGKCSVNGATVITNCHSSGSVSGAGQVGGLVGFYIAGPATCTISYSSSSCGVAASSGEAGGLAGQGSFAISKCYATGNVVVTSSNNAGGLIGDSASGGSISDSYATGNASGIPGAGLIGLASSTNILRSYSTGYVSAAGLGFISTGGSCTNCYWDNESSGKLTTTCGASPKSTAQMKTQSTYSGFDFNTVWAMSNILNNGYPYLRQQDFGTQYSSFGASTNFNSASDKNNVSGAVLANGQGTIRWNNGINANGADFDSNVAIGNGFVSINSSKFDSTINSSANVSVQVSGCDDWTIYYANHPVSSLSQLIAEGSVVGTKFTGCTSYCSNPVCAGSTLTYTVPHFDGTGGSGSSATPEFSTITTLLALALVIGGFLAMRKRY